MEKAVQYRDFLQQVISEHFLDSSVYEGKNILFVGDGDSLVERIDLLQSLQQTFTGRVKHMDMVRLFNPVHKDSQGRLDEAEFPSDMLFDAIIVLDGWEKAWNPCRAAEKIDAALCPGGVVVLIARIPDDGLMPNVCLYQDRWRYEPEDLCHLFPGYEVKYTMTSNPSFLGGCILQKNSHKSVADCFVEQGEPALLYYVTGKRERPKAVMEQGYFLSGRGLDDIGILCHTDKCSLSNGYLDKYEMFLRPFQQKAFRLLELGVFTGCSMQLWKEYFSRAEIYGVDINPECRQFEQERVHILTADLGNASALRILRDIHPSIIIDDASHLWSHQIMAMCELYSSLPSGGIYIMEDLATSLNTYMLPGYSDYPMDAYTFCERVARVTASRCPCPSDTSLASIITEIGMSTELVSILMGSCIFIKR